MTNNRDTTTASGEAGTARRTTAAARWGGLAACVALMPLTTPAIAQMGEGVEAESRQATVIVTATKREASIQDVAASISQVGGDDLETRGVDDVENLALQIPNLTFGKFGRNTFVTVRGIGTTVDSGVAEPSVATYVDGVFLPRATMALLRQVDLERVEVLRGPQGTLYGRNATGGAVNYVSRGPSDTFEGKIVATFEERNGRGVDAVVSGPISEGLSFRLSGGVQKQDGYVKVLNTGQDLGDQDLWHARGALKIEPSDNVTIDLSVQHEEDTGNFGWQSVVSEPFVVAGTAALFMTNANFTTTPNQVYADGDHSGNAETTIAIARVNWDVSETVSFRSITGYVDHEIDNSFDADGTNFFFADLTGSSRPSQSFSQEFNLYGQTGALDWLIGAYYFSEEFELGLPVEFPGVLFGVPTVPRLEVIAGDLVEDTESYAAFADVTYALTERLRINAGLRFNAEEKEFTFFGAPSPAGNIDSEDVLPKLGMQFDVSNNVNVYANWQKGIKSGGHQLSLPQLFDSEELDAYELGIKSQWMNGALTANAALFSYDYTNLQATITIPPATTLVENGDAELIGLEGELMYAATDNIAFNMGVSLLDTEYTDLITTDQALPGTPAVDLTGEELIRAPEFTANFGAEWNIPINSGFLGSVRLRGDVFHSADYKLAFIDYPELRQSEYTNINLSATLTDTSGNYQLRAFVNNATDEIILNNGSYLASSGGFIGIHSAPRTAGVSLSAKF
ncbi:MULTISPECIES: TonB-dependent receptor [unclassified Hyphomonas]|jgi:iron complex outermembrane receptor protein|uniref:TonB-dependent receptor n=2 Tax=Hyphomonas TaxID=85 RepID=UPI0025C3F8AA|nr:MULTISPECIES: TonB-dependent receptor [unclassified Hyphomonas]|tara:strand:+ start:3496 stop:5709 length:2214 start_codon:yes stop_codon:yes gene_type:complete